mmetsp:Transcript_21490/g.61397  ORF Transcript_21490/g.61397 Transcript_21490/m.61397 type:complete len:212 (+) Transcript_21490:4406-5041(+)
MCISRRPSTPLPPWQAMGHTTSASSPGPWATAFSRPRPWRCSPRRLRESRQRLDKRGSAAAPVPPPLRAGGRPCRRRRPCTPPSRGWSSALTGHRRRRAIPRRSRTSWLSSSPASALSSSRRPSGESTSVGAASATWPTSSASKPWSPTHWASFARPSKPGSKPAPTPGALERMVRQDRDSNCNHEGCAAWPINPAANSALLGGVLCLARL